MPKISLLLIFIYKEVNYSDIKEPKELLDILNNYKVLVIKNYKNTEKVDDYLQNFVKSIGKIIGAGEDLHTGNPTENTLIEISYDPAEQMKYRTSKNAQPLHTDTSYTEFEDVPEFEENIKFLKRQKFYITKEKTYPEFR